MHIWYVHPYGGGPGIGLYDRPFRLARAWQEQGHSATVFIARFHHLLDRHEPLAPALDVEGVRYVTIPARSYTQKNGLARILNMWDFSRNLYAAGQRYGTDVPQPDAIVLSSPHPFAIFPAYRLARRYSAKLVFEVRDIWPLSVTEVLGASPMHPFVRMCAMAERFALTRSDLVASVMPRMDRYLADRGYGSKPFIWVPNGLDPRRSEEESSLGATARAALSTLSRWETEGYTTLVYAGRLGKPNAVNLLLEAVSVGVSRGQARDLRVMLVGAGDQYASLKALTQKHRLDGVCFAGHVAKGEVASLLRASHIAYAGAKPLDRLYRYGISPNKMADYYAAALPVLLPMPPCGDPVSESGGGIARGTETPEAVWEALSELLILSPDERRALGEKGKAYMVKEYDYDRIALRYVEAVAAL